MNRREFIGNLSLGLAAAWAGSRFFWPVAGEASDRPISLALLADAHLSDGDPGRFEARALARAVAEIRALRPAPRLVLFAGDLAHDGNPMALALGEEILSELPMPVLAVRGEGDGRPQKGEAGGRLLAEGRFFHHEAGVTFLGLDTVLQKPPEGPAFALGEAQHRWLDHVLSRLDPAAPLLVLSHAPLVPIFPAWGQWTADRGPLLKRLCRFENVLCFHGHVHQAITPSGENFEAKDIGHFRQPNLHGHNRPLPAMKIFYRGGVTPPLRVNFHGKTENRKPMCQLALPATSWPLPSPLTGTPETLRPGSGPRGCGWAYVPPGGQAAQVRQVLWQA